VLLEAEEAALDGERDRPEGDDVRGGLEERLLAARPMIGGMSVSGSRNRTRIAPLRSAA
jgi:hypothetical protein